MVNWKHKSKNLKLQKRKPSKMVGHWNQPRAPKQWHLNCGRKLGSTSSPMALNFYLMVKLYYSIQSRENMVPCFGTTVSNSGSELWDLVRAASFALSCGHLLLPWLSHKRLMVWVTVEIIRSYHQYPASKSLNCKNFYIRKFLERFHHK